MGRHATNERRRGIAAWPIAAAVAVVLVAAAVVTFVVANRKDPAAGACTGAVTLQVTASPLVAPAVSEAAKAFVATGPQARSACVTVAVTPLSGQVAADRLIAGWKSTDGPAPAMWVVDSPADLAAVDTANSSLTAGRATAALATSPVVLATRTGGPLAALELSWKQLPELAGQRGTSTGGRFLLALPDPAVDPASQAAGASVVAAVTGKQTVDAAAVGAAGSALTALAGSAAQTPRLPDTAAALTALSTGNDAPFDAVPAFEAQVAAAGAGGQQLTALYPAGPTAVAQVMTAALKGSWVDQTAAAAAALFDGFLADPQGLQILADHGFRVPDRPAAKPLAGVDTSRQVTALAEPGDSVRQLLAQALSAAPAPTSTPTVSTPPTVSSTPKPPSSTPKPPSSTPKPPTTPTTAPTTPTTATPAPPAGPVITFLVDTSSAMDTVVDGKNRNEWLQGALTGATGSRPTADFGLWTVSTQDGDAGFTQRVPTGPLTAKVGEVTRAAALATATSQLAPGGSSWMYGAIRTGYAEAAAKQVGGRANTVIVVVAGPDRTPSLSRSELITAVQAAAAGKQVRLEIIGLSDSVNTEAMTQIAAAGGGSYRQISAADLAATVTDLLR